MKKLLFACMLCGAAVYAQESASKAPEKTEQKSEEGLKMWEWVNFGLLALGLGYLLGKTLPPFFKSRTSEIQKDIVDAQQTRKQAEERAAAIEKRVSALGAEVESFRAQAKTEMEQEGARIREETQRMIAKVQQQAEAEIETAGKIARRELQSYASKLALELAEQRIRSRMNAETEGGLVSDFVRDLEHEGSKN